MNNIITKKTDKKRYHLFQKEEMSLIDTVCVCRYCTVSGIFYSVRVFEEDWYPLYYNKITVHLKDKLKEDEYRFLNRNLTPKELEKEI